MKKKKKGKWSRSVVSDSLRPHGLQPARLLHPWDFPTGVGCHRLQSFIMQVRPRPYTTGMVGREHDARSALLCSQHITDWAQPSAFSRNTAPKSSSPSASPERLRLTPQETPTPHPWYHVYGTTTRMWSQDDPHLDSHVPSWAWHREPATILTVGKFWNKQLTPQKKIFSSQANSQSGAFNNTSSSNCGLSWPHHLPCWTA